MKQKVLFFLSLLAVSAMPVLTVHGADTASVTVTIADENGDLGAACETVTVTDADADGTLTIYDALYCAHDALYEGGTSGFSAEESQYGLSMTKLWGSDTHTAFGYYVNHASAMSLRDPIQDGDIVDAFVYTDLQNWTDTYCYFDVSAVQKQQGEQVELTLLSVGYDENYMPITLPVQNAVITLDGNNTQWKTDTDGKVTILAENVGEHLISAESQKQILVPPVCKMEVAAAPQPETQAPTQVPTQAPTQVPTQNTSEKKSQQPASVPSTGDSGRWFILAAVCSGMTALFARKRS